jgi:membrane-bound ClpP family serine protease
MKPAFLAVDALKQGHAIGPERWSQISMSGGTIIALAAREIVMGLHSNLGPIDPQFGHSPAIAILKEFERARADIIADPKLALLWQPILQRYEPTLLSRAEYADMAPTGAPIFWSEV